MSGLMVLSYYLYKNHILSFESGFIYQKISSAVKLVLMAREKELLFKIRHSYILISFAYFLGFACLKIADVSYLLLMSRGCCNPPVSTLGCAERGIWGQGL